MPMRLNSAAFDDEGRIPDLYTCTGTDTSPPLSWIEPPAETQGFAVLCEDPDAPNGTFRHWAMFDIPAHMRELPEGFAGRTGEGIRQGRNDFGKVGYGGPCPPPGHGVHRYRFRLFALNAAQLPVSEDPSYRDVEEAVKQHLVAEAELVGFYSR